MFCFGVPTLLINVSVQYNGGFLPEFMLLTLLSDNIIGEPFSYHVELLFLQSMFPPKPFDCSGGLAAFRFFLNT